MCTRTGTPGIKAQGASRPKRRGCRLVNMRNKSKHENISTGVQPGSDTWLISKPLLHLTSPAGAATSPKPQGVVATRRLRQLFRIKVQDYFG